MILPEEACQVQPGLYTMAAGRPFLQVLAQGLLRGEICSREDLSEVEIFLPTRRACRVLQSEILRQNEGGAVIMPRMRPIGEVDEEELLLTFPGFHDYHAIRPEMPPLQRQMILARLISARRDINHSYDQALGLADALGRLMDQIYTQNLDMRDLANLVPDEFSKHWQITLGFLEILSEAWPKILEAEGKIDRAQRRNMLMLALADHWRQSPPDSPVIVAGTTGSIPATAQVLKAVYALPKGYIILPGLDQDLDEDSVEVLAESHPQYGMKILLEQLGTDFYAVREWPNGTFDEMRHARSFLSREIMRPAELTEKWVGLGSGQSKAIINKAVQNLYIQECDSEREEAQQIAIILRSVLEEDGKTACLITPDRALAMRVKAACMRWGIVVDDSAAGSLFESAIGGYLNALVHVVVSDYSPSALLALLQHSLCLAGMERREYDKGRSALDQALRGSKPRGGFEGLRAHIEKNRQINENVRGRALEFLECLIPYFESFDNGGGHSRRFKDYLQAHLKCAELLAQRENKSLWQGHDGQCASEFFMHLSLSVKDEDVSVTLDEYVRALQMFLKAVSYRAEVDPHPRLQILGQLEARLWHADIVILGGMNEGVWPATPSADPWMSRPMRAEFGLPLHERSVGLAAHDFTQALCVGKVYITRSLKSDGAPSVPSRWLQRMDAVLEAAGCGGIGALENTDIHAFAQKLDSTQDYAPVLRPSPSPPYAVRPRRLPVTDIEMWLKDPYSIYAKRVLKLRKLDEVEKEADAALRGTVLHEVFARFIDAHRGALPLNGEEQLMQIFHDVLEEEGEDAAEWQFWLPRYGRIFQWFMHNERDWREQGYAPHVVEVKGEARFSGERDPFVLNGRVDRIDKTIDGRGAIIDYKTGGSFTKKGLKTGEYPQLPLEALILEQGGFGVPMKTDYAGYWVMRGGNDIASVTSENEMDDTIEFVRAGFENLIRRFDDEGTPYISLPRADKFPRFNDYLHLARYAEWAALDDAEGEGE